MIKSDKINDDIYYIENSSETVLNKRENRFFEERDRLY